jgi:phosphopantetheinyl transferase
VTANAATVLWIPFTHPPGADRAALRSLGREASRAAFRAASAAWAHAHGPAPWAAGEQEIEHDPFGAPLIARRPGAPWVSFAHARGLGGCAIAAPGAPAPGIDCEPVDAPASAALRELARQTGEDALAWADDHWPLRLWCAKESVVKAERVGADAMGRSLRVQHAGALNPDGTQLLVVRSHRDRVFAVTTAVDAAHVRAWTS